MITSTMIKYIVFGTNQSQSIHVAIKKNGIKDTLLLISPQREIQLYITWLKVKVSDLSGKCIATNVYKHVQ